MAIIPVRLDHHLSGMKVVPPRASMARMPKILHVMRHRVHSRNATLTAPLGSLRLGQVVVHGKTKAGGNGGNGGKTVTMAAATGGKRCGGSRRAAAAIRGCGGCVERRPWQWRRGRAREGWENGRWFCVVLCGKLIKKMLVKLRLQTLAWPILSLAKSK